ncbi:MAG: sulfatase [Myxococcota bacterium]
MVFAAAMVAAAGCSRSTTPSTPTGTAQSITPGRTSLLLIVIDTARADHFSMYGYPHETTPFLDRWAEQGVRFDNAFSNSSWTRPGMAALLTGRYAREVGVYEERYDRLPDDAVTLAERMKAQGYLTLGVNANPNVNAWFGFDQGFDEYGDSGRVWRWMAKEGAGEPVRKGHQDIETAETVNQRLLALLDHHEASLASQPWFLQLLYIDPHAPYQAPAKHRRAVGSTGVNKEYDAELHYVDAAIGDAMAALQKRGMLDDTLVIITSDHGEGLDSYPAVPLSDRHGDTVYDAMVKIPLVFIHPSLKPGVVPDLVGSIDVVPTTMALLGSATEDVSGTSMAARLMGAGEETGHPGFVISESDWQISNKVSVRTASHRYIENLDSEAYQQQGLFEGRSLKPAQRRFLKLLPPRELYALAPGTLEALKDERLSEDVAVGQELAAVLADWKARTPLRPPLGRSEDDVFTLKTGEVVPAVNTAAAPALPDDMRSALKALGYLDEESP